MIGILVDPHKKTLTEIELPPDGVSFAPLIDCEYFDTVALRRPLPGDPGVALYLDDTGMTVEGQKFWSFAEHPDRIFAGKGLLTAVNEAGETCEGLVDPEVIAPHVIWRAVRYVGITEHVEENVEIMPGVTGFKVTREAQFEPEEDKT